MKTVLSIIGIVVGLMVAAVAGTGYYIFSDMCANTIVSSSVSPDGTKKMVLFERDCGATTGFSSHVSLLSVRDKLGNTSGNIYIANGYPEGYAITWESGTSVVIHGARAERHKSESHSDGVQIHYQ